MTIHEAIARIRAHLNTRRNAREGATRGPYLAKYNGGRGFIMGDDGRGVCGNINPGDMRNIVRHADPDTAEALDRVLEALLVAVEAADALAESYSREMPEAGEKLRAIFGIPNLIAAAEALPNPPEVKP